MTRSTFYHDGYRDAGLDTEYRNYSAPDAPIYAQEYEQGYLYRIIDDRGCSRDTARVHAGRPDRCWVIRFGNSRVTFRTEYHAEQYARALTLNQTLYTMERPL